MCIIILLQIYNSNPISMIAEIRKVLTKIAKESGGEVLQPWIHACENHLTWSATTTQSGDGKVVSAKFK